eukprot:scaffold9586_cov109-Cylindrotheca_fusiformis.AAC.1
MREEGSFDRIDVLSSTADAGACGEDVEDEKTRSHPTGASLEVAKQDGQLCEVCISQTNSFRSAKEDNLPPLSHQLRSWLISALILMTSRSERHPRIGVIRPAYRQTTLQSNVECRVSIPNIDDGEDQALSEIVPRRPRPD